MINEFSKTFFLSANEANPERELAVNILVSNIIETATAHANSLGIGNPSMEHLGAGWVLSRLTLEMKEYPKINTNYTLTTWIESWNRHFSTRDFEIADQSGKIIGYARSVWMVLNMNTHENFGLSHLSLPDDAQSSRPCPISPQQKHVEILPMCTPDDKMPAKALRATEEAAFYTFTYSDIDFYRHVNTVRYISLLHNQFTLEEFDRYQISRLELSFLHEGNYGVKVAILRHHHANFIGSDQSDDKYSKDIEGETSFSIINAETHLPILFSRIVLTERSR